MKLRSNTKNSFSGEESEKPENSETDFIAHIPENVLNETPKVLQNGDKIGQQIKRILKVRRYDTPKSRNKPTGKNLSSSKRTVKAVNGEAKTIKVTEHSSEIGIRSVKTADNAVKATEEIAESSKKAMQSAKKLSQQTEKTKRLTESTVNAVKNSMKTISKVAKYLPAASKELVTWLAGLSPTVLIIISVVLCAGISCSCFGIFLSNDTTTGTKQTMSETIQQLTSEHYNSLAAVKAGFDYDTVTVSGNTAIIWKEVLAVFAVKYTNADDGFEVVTLDEVKINKLREIMNDMNKATGAVTPRVEAVISTKTDENGNQITVTQYNTTRVLTVTNIRVPALTQAELYHFTDEQKAQLTELLKPAYDALWAELISSMGQILNPDAHRTPNNIFIWPLTVSGTITSEFGTRADPFTGEIKHHGGTDIAAPAGTPILAAADGFVTAAAYNSGGYGFYVRIQHNDTYQTLYGHCSVLYVTAGQTVKQGQLIAEVGSTGYSTGNHLHFEVYENGTRVNAMIFYK